MSTRDTSAKADPVIESRDQLVAPMQKGEKPKDQWRIGTEHEKLVFHKSDHRAPSYDEQGGIRDILTSLRQFGWEPVEEGGEGAADAFCLTEGPAALLTGPEGGFTDEERATIRAHPAAHAVSLGPRILRGETAALAGIAVWMAEAGDWLGEE